MPRREAHLTVVEHWQPLRFWSADILVRLFVLVNTKADRNVRAPWMAVILGGYLFFGKQTDKFAPAILRPCQFVMTRTGRFVFAVADGANPLGADAISG
jgi:hypothetical protein